MTRRPLIIACSRGSVRESLETFAGLNFRANYYAENDALIARRSGRKLYSMLVTLDKNIALPGLTSTHASGNWALVLLVPCDDLSTSDGDVQMTGKHGPRLQRMLRRAVLDPANTVAGRLLLAGPWSIRKFCATYPTKCATLKNAAGEIYCPAVFDGNGSPEVMADADYQPSDAACIADTDDEGDLGGSLASSKGGV